jgi:hypothetical protein
MVDTLLDGVMGFFGPQRRPDGARRVDVDPGQIARLWSFYCHDDACGRCRNIIGGMIMSDMTIGVSWEGKSLSKTYVDLLRQSFLMMFDCAIAIGFVAWRWDTAYDQSGQAQAIPYVLSPTSGRFYQFWKDDALVGMKFVAADAETMKWRTYDVAYLLPYAPDKTGMMRSALSNVIMRMFLSATAQNSEVQAATVRARPPLVVEQPSDAFLNGSAIDDFRDNGGTSIERAESDAAAVSMQQGARERAAGAANAAAGSNADAPGSGLYVPDPFTGRWPGGQQRGPFFGNRIALPPGYKLARQEMPSSIVDSEKWRASSERVICNMFGISSTLLYPDSATSRFKSSVDDAVKITRSLALGNLRWVALMMQDVLNAMFQVTDSVRVALESITAARDAGAVPDKLGKTAAREIARTNRYRVKVSFGHTATDTDLAELYHDGILTLDSYKRLIAKHYHLDPAVVDGDGVQIPLPTRAAAADATTGPPRAKKRKEDKDGEDEGARS